MGLFDWLKGKAPQENGTSNKNGITFETSITSRYVTLEQFIAKGYKISKLNLGGYVSPSGGYVNYAMFEVSGTNAETKRKNKRRYIAQDEAGALELAEKDGLQNPEIIAVIPHEEPTEKQRAYLESWGVMVPSGACKYDVSAMLDRLEQYERIVKEIEVSEDHTKEYVEPGKGPSEEFAMFAHKMGLRFSKFVGASELHEQVVHGLPFPDKAAFFAYCVLCNHKGATIGDMLKAENLEQLYVFGEMVKENPTLTRSIGGRDPQDYLKPNKGTAAYKAVAEYFNL